MAIGSWKKLRSLGKGSYGKVFLASPKKDRKTLIAVKSAGVFYGDGRYQCLVNEERFLKELIGEPHIVRCFGMDRSEEDDRYTYNLLLEYATGGHLDDLILSSPRTDATPTRVANFTRMLLTALSRIHAHGIVHCDLNPKNVLVFNNDGHIELKIADFGLALWLDSDERDEHGHRGTKRYSSPESLARGEHGTCTDIWSLGIIVAEMMDPGRYFFYKKNNVSVYDQIVHQPLELKRRVPRGFDDPHVVNFLEKCLDREPANRWSAEELLKHPFITENHSLVVSENHHSKSENPIEPSSEWSSSQHLFSNEIRRCLICGNRQCMENLFRQKKRLGYYCRDCAQYLPCVACANKQRPPEMIKLSNCSHLFCKDCAVESAWKIIKDDIYQPRCRECDEVLDLDLTRSNPELFSRWSNALAEAAGIAELEYTQCPFGPCKRVFLSDKKSLSMKKACPECNADICVDCKDSWHEGLTCEQNKAPKEEAEIDIGQFLDELMS